jgi:hypothetical protein
MGQFSSSGAGQLTKEAISAALSSGSIKLLGPGSAIQAENNGKTDALYLSTLLNSLYQQLKSNNAAD